MKRLLYIIAALILCSFTVEEEREAKFAGRIQGFTQTVDSMMPRIKELTGLPACVFIVEGIDKGKNKMLIADTAFTRAYAVPLKGKRKKAKEVEKSRLRFMDTTFQHAKTDIYTGPTVLSDIKAGEELIFFAICDTTGQITFPFIDSPICDIYSLKKDRRFSIKLVWCAILIDTK